jgi:hypothetical protein
LGYLGYQISFSERFNRSASSAVSGKDSLTPNCKKHSILRTFDEMEPSCSSLKPTILIGSGLRGSHRFVSAPSAGVINARLVTPSSNA